MGDLIVTLRAGHYFANPGTGSHHGSLYPEDLAIPILVAAPNLSAGHRTEAVSITQIAHTLADYLGFVMESADPPLPIRTRVRTSTRQ
jgi:hypothetical protein